MRIRQGIRRKFIQITAFGFTNSHVGNLTSGGIYQGRWKHFCSPGLNCYSCPAAGLACPIGAMQAIGGAPKYGVSFYAAGFTLALGVLFGRAICGYVCPFGLIQELLHKIPSPKIHLPKPLTFIKYVLLAGCVLLLPALVTDRYGIGAPAFCEFICPAGTLEGGLPLLLNHPELRMQLGTIFIAKAGILAVTILGCILCMRFFCKIMCPLGAIYGLLNRVSLYRLHVVADECISCGACRASCPMDVYPVMHPDSAECIRCGRCAGGCPRQAISLGFAHHRGVCEKKLQEELSCRSYGPQDQLLRERLIEISGGKRE